MDSNLVILTWVGIISIAVIVVFLARLLHDLSDLVKSMTKGSEMVQEELEPTLKELNEAASSLNKVTGIAKDQVEGIQKIVNNITSATTTVGSKLQGFLGGVVDGIKAGFKLFKK